MTKFQAPNPVYLGPAKFHGEANNKPIRRIVLHSTVGPTKAGSARAVARYFRESVVRPSSAHYVVDAGEVVQVVYDSVEAYHAPPSLHTLAIEMCDYPIADPEKGLLRWKDKDHRDLLRNTIHLTVDLLLAYNIRPVFLTVPLLVAGDQKYKNGAAGITTHNNVSHAFHESTHWDPGAWPQIEFMHRTRARYNKLKG